MMQLWRTKYSTKKYVLYRKIEGWINIYNVCNRNFTKRVLEKILHINVCSIEALSVRNQCVNVFTNNYLYKVQLYGDNLKKDLENRILFCDKRIPLLSPVNVYKKYPFVVKMPILDQMDVDDASVTYIFNELKKSGYEAEFRMKDYPLIIEGLSILKSCSYGVQTVKKIKKYLWGKEGIKVRVGIVHGDLHRGNIMYKDGRPLLIDFDCVRYCDVQDIDILYFMLEEIRHQHGYKKTWLDEWLQVYENTKEIQEFSFLGQIEIDLKFGLILLCLERLAQNYRENSLFVKQNKKSIRNINWKLYKL